MKNYFEVFSTKKIKRVLSFDGGGVRAIAGVVFLKQLEVATGKSIFDLFDSLIFLMQLVNLLSPAIYIKYIDI